MWLDWAHEGDPGKSPHLKVYNLNRICKVCLSPKVTYSQRLGYVWEFLKDFYSAYFCQHLF